MHSVPQAASHAPVLHGTYSALVYHAHQTLNSIKKSQQVKLDGDNLDIPSVVAVSRYVVYTILLCDPQASQGLVIGNLLCAGTTSNRDSPMTMTSAVGSMPVLPRLRSFWKMATQSMVCPAD